MKKSKFTFGIFLFLSIITCNLYSQILIDNRCKNIDYSLQDFFIIQRVKLLPNNISAYFQNTGIFNQNTTTGNRAGFEWPKGSGKTACFTSGISIGCGINGQYAQVMASYTGEWAPGKVLNGIFYTNNDFKIYSVFAGDNSSTNPDYANWYKMVPYGAPWVDKNNNGIYEQEIDFPGIKNAGQTIFQVLTDADSSARKPGEGFGGGIVNPLLRAELRFTAWAYTTTGLEDVQFIDFVIINKGNNIWDSVFTGIVNDVDLGNADDDYIGCDTTKDLGFCYNGDNNDPQYGLSPPAFGIMYLRTPIKKSQGQPNDTLGMTSFNYFTCISCVPPPCESDPNGEPIPAYHMLQGLKKDRTPWMDPSQNPPKKTKFTYPGDPETNSGWTEFKGMMKNCNGDTTGTIIPSNSPGDRRMILGSGSKYLRIFPSDTQKITIAQMVRRGLNFTNSVTQLKKLAYNVKLIYDRNFEILSPPPVPLVNKSITHKTPSTCDITLFWNDASEKYYYWDSIYFLRNDSNIYTFEGYEIYELNKNINTLPDFSRPYTINQNDVKLLKIYDYRNNLGVIIDTLPTGVFINGQEFYAPMPIVPPYGLGTPTEFPNNGLSRSIFLTETKFPQNYGGNQSFLYGESYKFAVVSYAVSKSTHITKGFKVIRTPLEISILNIIPQPKPPNVTYHLKNGDTLNTSRRDLGVTPVVIGQEFIQDALYKVIFATPDTLYNILKSVNNGTSWDTVKKGLKYTNGYFGTAQDSSRIIDGIFIDVDKIRMTYTAPGYYNGNAGVIRDPVVRADSIQTRLFGYEYQPVSHQFLTGSRYIRSSDRPWHSASMSLSYPCNNTFSGVRSALTAEYLRKIRIKFTTNGQMAYRFLDTSLVSDNYYIYQSMVQVPFTVYETDNSDSTPSQRQLNCAFVESNDISPATGQWTPKADSLGSKLLLYIFNSDYSSSPDPNYTTKNLFFSQLFDVMYIWSPRLINAGGNFSEGDSLFFYPYTVTRPGIYYEFSTHSPTVGIKTISSEIPKQYELIQNYPNPFNSSTIINYSIPQNGLVSITVYDVAGRKIKDIVTSSFHNAGTYSVSFDGSGLASGIYFYRIHAKGKTEFIAIKKMVLVK